MWLTVLEQTIIDEALNCLLLILEKGQSPMTTALVLEEMAIVTLFLSGLCSNAMLEVLMKVSTVCVLSIRVHILTVALEGSFLKLAIIR